MSTDLSNGVIIPEEYSDDWYDEMSINLRKLNDVITAASDNATDIQRLDTDKANQSDLSALTSRVSQNETDIIALQTAVSGALKREIVQTLPTEDISTTTIYMIRNSQSSGTNIYDEYMYINSQWELIGTSATDFSNYYTKNETDNLLSGKVDNSTLGSYYTKTESDNLLSAKANQTDLTALGGRVTQTETDITALQTAVSGALKREIVQSLPTQDISTTTIYMIRNTTTSGDNIYDEYMYINNLWELIGTSATDFSNYYTKTEIDTLLSGKADDNSVVHRSGNESISGDKVFNNRLIKNIDVVLGTAPSTGKFSNIDIADNNKASLLQILGGVYNTGNSYARFFIQNKMADDGTGLSPTGTLRGCGFNINLPATSTSEGVGSITPRANKTTDFGLLSYQWRNLWCEKLFLNGTQLDPSAFVTTDTAQTISGNKTFGNGTLTVDNCTGSNVHGEIKFNGSRSGYIVADNASDGVFDNAECGISVLLQDSGKPLHIGGYKVDANGRVFVDNTNKKPVLSIKSSLIQTTTLVPENDSTSCLFRIISRLDYANGDPAKILDVRFQQNDDADATSAIYSNNDNKTSLGVSSRKWSDVLTYKVNGLTPSSLGMPSDRTARVDISGYFTNMGNGGINRYTAVANGFIYLKVSNVVTMHMMSLGANTLSNYADTKGRNSTGLLYGLFPVRKDDVFTCEWYTTATNVTLDNAYFIPCLGNI